MMLLVARIKCSDLTWLKQVGNLSTHVTGGLIANHTPGLVDSVALSVITDSILSGFGPVIHGIGLVLSYPQVVRWLPAATMSSYFPTRVQC